jgi:hypothetical protein
MTINQTDGIRYEKIEIIDLKFKPWIARAAIKTAAGKVYSLDKPARHHDVIALMVESKERIRGDETEGFIAALPQGPTFVDRAAAKRIALRSGQITKTISDTLTSEDLW